MRGIVSVERLSLRCILLTAIVLLLPVLGHTQAAQAPSGAPVPIMEQPALDLLKRMSDTLRAAGAFTYRSRHAVEVPATTGQFVTLFGTSEVALARPNKLSVRVTGEVPNFEFQYDGTRVVAFAARDRVYSVASAPDTIDGMLPFLEEKTGIHFASADIMFSDPYAALTKGLTGAFVVGPARVDGVACEHLAFMGPGVHWEIWIETRKRALPRRLTVTYTGATNFPRFLVGFSDWNLHPKLPASRFVFKKPADAKQVEFRPGAAQATQ